MNFITVKEAAAIDGTGVVNVYKAMRSGILRSQKLQIPATVYRTRGWQYFTTKEWVEEWQKKKRKKEHMRFNGKPMFNPQNGEMTSGQASRYLGLRKNQFFNYIYTGRVKFCRKNRYYIFNVEDLEKLRELIEENKLEKIA